MEVQRGTILVERENTNAGGSSGSYDVAGTFFELLSVEVDQQFLAERERRVNAFGPVLKNGVVMFCDRAGMHETHVAKHLKVGCSGLNVRTDQAE